MTVQTFVNLPVKDLAKTTEFFSKLGFSFDRPSPDGQTTRMIISDDASVMFHTEPFFERFTGGDITDPSKSREVVVGLSTASREEVDELVDLAVAAGGQDVGGPVDQGFMYMRPFLDVDGHRWSFLFMDMSAMPER